MTLKLQVRHRTKGSMSFLFLFNLTKTSRLIMSITIQEFIDQNIVYCVSTLVWELTQKNCDCLSEEDKFELWAGRVDYGRAKYELELERDSVFKHYYTEDNQYYFGVRNEHGVWKIDPIYNDEETAIYEWFEIYRGGSLDDYRQEIFEHWIVSSWLASKLEAFGETVVRDFYGLNIYCRPCTGQALYCDYVIQKSTIQ